MTFSASRRNISPPTIARSVGLFRRKVSRPGAADSAGDGLSGIQTALLRRQPQHSMTNSFSTRTARFTLPNGITLLVLENHANPTVSVTGYLKAGAFFNPQSREGLADLTAAMLNKGTKRRSKLEIAEALEFAGAHVGFSANTFTVGIDAQSLSRDFPFVVSTLAEELREPAFPTDELSKLKQRTIASIQRSQENTRGRAVERLTQIIFPKSSPFYELPAVEAIRRFYKARYGAASMILSVVGDVTAAEVEKLATDNLGDWRGAPAPQITVKETPLQAEPRRDVVPMKDKANVDVVIGHASGLRRTNPDYLAAVLANRALGQSTISS